jgi:hypothetical protein
MPTNNRQGEMMNYTNVEPNWRASPGNADDEEMLGNST